MKILNTLIASSSDPQKLSMTVTGAIVMILSLLIPHANIGADEVSNIIDGIINVGHLIMQVFAALTMIWGGIRKLFARARGQAPKVAPPIGEIH